MAHKAHNDPCHAYSSVYSNIHLTAIYPFYYSNELLLDANLFDNFDAPHTYRYKYIGTVLNFHESIPFLPTFPVSWQ